MILLIEPPADSQTQKQGRSPLLNGKRVPRGDHVASHGEEPLRAANTDMDSVRLRLLSGAIELIKLRRLAR
ncbi:uncharacterized protein PHALS_02741 [Plasmopara halstedii]|uniref:Uncharacterized protein n=1 Tax=Plasmopara halstedii TaxID=4781 RepID=A0A0P1AXZ7_PLAHL|nr:uncharacterized protein PHALS_02741 [Plasmopara halstedii]CEG46337.1 hypothetical protein PHALS_02741 [Plasmopara halstedii]|eukprot:XP_024582706.1 hypothetical protein PHALS_02741 [Plasmopara halstedii]